MANDEHLEILKMGVEAWNRWREENRGVPFLTDADLRKADLRGADLHGARLDHARLNGARLDDANLRGARLDDANLRNANLRGADLRGAILHYANLHDARLDDAHLGGADLRGAILDSVSLVGTDFGVGDLWAPGRGTHERFPSGPAAVGFTVFANVDLRQVNRLENALPLGPCHISTSTLERSQGQIPPTFLQGCGLSDWEIEATKLWKPDLRENERIDITDEIHRLRGQQPIQVNPLFISYSHADSAFLKVLEPQFDERGIRYWRDVHDMRAGRMETQIDLAIRLNPTVLLVLSEKSVASDWVEWEAAKAREREKELGRDVLCPVALDEAWKTCSWSGPLRRQIQDYHILDFSGWQDAATFELQFGKLIDGLGLFYQGKHEDS